MENQNRLLVVLAAVLLLLVAAILVIEQREDEPKTEAADEYSALFADLKAERVERLELQIGEETRVFVRHEDGWRIAAPVEAEGDAVRIDAIVGSLATAEAGEPLPGDASDFGLEPPQAVARLTTADGSTHELRIGRDSPVGGHTYLQAGADQPIRASRTRLSSTISTPLVELRVRQLWTLPPGSLDSFDLDSPVARLELRRKGGDWWVRASLAPSAGDLAPSAGDLAPALEGLAWRADRARVEAILAELGALEATGFVHAPVFNAEALPWSLKAGAAGASWELRAGQTDDGSWVASAPRQTGLVTLDPSWVQALILPVTEWWARDLLRVDRLDTLSMELELGERRLSASQAGGSWSPPEAEKTLAAIAAVRVDRARPVTIEGPRWGFVQLQGSEGEPRRVELHQELPEGGRAAIDPTGGAAFALPSTELSRLLDALPAVP